VFGYATMYRGRSLAPGQLATTEWASRAEIMAAFKTIVGHSLLFLIARLRPSAARRRCCAETLNCPSGTVLSMSRFVLHLRHTPIVNASPRGGGMRKWWTQSLGIF
jgi:hypothetical protein